MSNEEKEKLEQQDKTMMFLLKMIGSDVVAPQEITRKHLEKFKITCPEDSEEITNAMIEIAKLSRQEKLEAVQILIMHFLTMCDIHKLQAFLRDFVNDSLVCIRDNEQYRATPDDIKKNLDDLFS